MNTNTSSFLKTASKQQLLDSFFRAAIGSQLPIAFWRKPDEQEQHLIVDLSGDVVQQSPDLEELGEGFIVAPFDNEGQAYFLHADLHVKIPHQEITESFRTSVYGSAARSNKEHFFEQWNALIHQHIADAPKYYEGKATVTGEVEQEAYEALVTQGVEAIKSGAFKKVVLSRRKSIALPANFNPIKTFLELCEAYPTAFISLVSIPKVGTWMGASPETLVHVNDQQQFHTIALAGTQPRANYEDLADAMWRQKEIEEQAMVSRYIINCFKKIRLREFEEDGPKTAQAGNLIHLKTDFMVDMKAVNFLDLGSVMLKLLHPTSAVCGLPMKESFEFIKVHEGYDRALYSGYLGPVNIQHDTHIFVNLRCMQLLETQALLYAGGGLTKDSKPEREWDETEFKMELMLKRLVNKD
ncbi:MAG: chorismate-binding protein [Flammeovirgaceae bacterium]